MTEFYMSPAYGCYNEDAASPQYTLQWNSLKEMEIHMVEKGTGIQVHQAPIEGYNSRDR